VGDPRCQLIPTCPATLSAPSPTAGTDSARSRPCERASLRPCRGLGSDPGGPADRLRRQLRVGMREAAVLFLIVVAASKFTISSLSNLSSCGPAHSIVGCRCRRVRGGIRTERGRAASPPISVEYGARPKGALGPERRWLTAYFLVDRWLHERVHVEWRRGSMQMAPESLATLRSQRPATSNARASTSIGPRPGAAIETESITTTRQSERMLLKTQKLS
jgi:hypothetical protein